MRSLNYMFFTRYFGDIWEIFWEYFGYLHKRFPVGLLKIM